MKIDQVAAILYTLRDYVQTPDDLKRTLEKVSEIGYRAVQVSGVPSDVMPPEAIARHCNENGLTLCATHEPPDLLFQEPEKAVDRLKAMGVSYTAYPFPANADLTTAGGLREFLDNLTRSTEILAAEGITLCYHNHNNEFIKVEGKLVYERIFDETPIQAEPDTYWIQAGGAGPLEWVRRLEGRMPLLHLKDMAIAPPREQRYAEIGSGNINFKPIIEAADAGGCQWFIVEQDECYGRDPFECIADSFQALRKLARG